MIKTFWKWPWKFRQNNLIFLGLVTVGFLVEYASGTPGVKAPPFPTNLYGLVGLLIVSAGIYIIPIFQRYIRWVMSFQFVITAVTWMGFLSLLSGFIPQGKSSLPVFFEKIAFSSLTSSVPFLLLVILICQSLLYACLNRVFRFTLRELPFLLNHLGLFIIFSAALAGSGDLVRLKMDLYKGNPEWKGYQHSFGAKVALPFALRLEKFEMDVYPPKLLVVAREGGEIVNSFPFIRLNEKNFTKKVHLKDWDIEIEHYYTDAFQVEDHFVPVKHVGTAPAVKLKVIDKINNKTITGWIGTGSFIFPAKLMNITESLAIALSNPQPREYRSKVSYFTKAGQKGAFDLRVNQPFLLDGWKIYQYSYDQGRGKWSNLSIVEVIRDPWLPAVYVGIYCLMAGTLLMLVIKRRG